MDKPVGSYEGGGYLQISMVLHKYQWRIRAHRVAWYLYYGKVPSNLIDHIEYKDKIDSMLSCIYTEKGEIINQRIH